MGVVYLAEDERLGRQVALKFLPSDAVSSRQALDRFRIEARAASSLSHPGICAIYDIGEEEGSPYIVMEALKGESLRDRINRSPIKIIELLEVGVQLADALDAAHTQGIIHRDIKPSNIFIGEKNRVKILDFGLAKLAQSSTHLSSGAVTRGLEASTHRELTMPGSTLGTVSYMSPEQARGEEVDTRTDLFSLGVVLYEMATGIQAFGGSTHAVVFDAILNRAPQRITHLNPLVPPRLEALIATALEKDRDLRHQHASDIEAELKRIRRDLESGSLRAADVSRTTVVSAVGHAPAAATSSEIAAPAKSSWRYVLAVLAIFVIAAIGAYMWFTAMRGSRVDSTPDSAATEPTTTATREVAPPVLPPPPQAPQQTAPAPAPTPAPARPEPSVGRGTQPTQPTKPSPVDVRPPVSQPPPAQTPRQSEPPPPTTTAPPTPAAGAGAVAPPPNDAPAPNPAPANTTPPNPAPTQVTPPAPSPAPATTEPPVQPSRNAAATPPATPPTSPVESDDTLIRRVIATYERAIETKSIDLFRSVRPALSAAEESRLRASFSQVDSQQVDVVVESLRVEGRTAVARITRRDTFVSGGRRQSQVSQQTLRFEKTPTGWIISEIGR
jgi:hypothetical protein